MKIYTASKLGFARMWRVYRAAWTDIEFVSRWIDENPDLSGGDMAEIAARFWRTDFEDLDRADALVIYGPPREKLRGALVEAGYAIAQGKPVIVIGSHPDYGTWQYHHLVWRVPLFEDAHKLLRQMERDDGQ